MRVLRVLRERRGRDGGARLPRRLVQLCAGLVLYGVSTAMMVRAGLGLGPWDVLHQGISEHTGLAIGTVTIMVGALVLLAWIPLRQRPGLGTVSNVVVIGLAMDAALAVLPDVRQPVAQTALLVCAVVLNGAATGMYISARFGPGPRDGLMTGLHRVTGRSVRVVRTVIELTVLAAGFLLGGTAGLGTVLYALTIGPLAQVFLRVFEVPGASPGPVPPGLPVRADAPAGRGAGGAAAGGI
ncbi:hypothetical protein PJ985_22745 [Streptomyces sp. ACA25]|uniref:membrane protein YczE n=1 Tax=Streptomyces sp. ACA25 TaxID=3022596 RepID=UPI0023076B34|nr:hypothetical protein [Streptomyces sp. ACA25]MDB1090371.1 hypothetical protein [Streptomyces sp. ACA25]